MLVGSFITDSNGNESFVAEDSTGFYLAKDAEIMVKVLPRKSSYLTATTIGGDKYREEANEQDT